MSENPVPLGPAFPERYNFLLVACYIIVRYGIMLYLPTAQHFEILDRVTVEFGESRYGLGLRSSLPDYQLIVSDIYALACAKIVEVTGAHHGNRITPFIFFVKCCFDQSSLDSKRRLGRN